MNEIKWKNKYLSSNNEDFINEEIIFEKLKINKKVDRKKVEDIIQKSLSITRLSPDEVATLLNVEDKDLLLQMQKAALEVKRKVYDNRIVIFAPLYCSNKCINSCLYCGFRKENEEEKRRTLTYEEIKKETENIIKLGHKRVIAVYGEHPSSNIDYIVDSVKSIYEAKVKINVSDNYIRRVNINAAPMSVEDLKKLKEAKIGTFQIFQETYHKNTYQKVHPSGIKADYRWRLYALHRAMETGIDDVAIGVLFGLYDWKFEVMGLLYHTMDLEKYFGGVGPHTISFPRLMPASGSNYLENSKYIVNDDAFKKLVSVIRLAVPYTGMIITARESSKIRKELINYGCTQTDASTRIGIGSYTNNSNMQDKEKQQFILGDTRDIDEVVREFAQMGWITSFCTAGYRCGRTGEKIMNMLKNCHEGKFCKLNAILTFREWLNDFASPKTKKIGEELLKKEIAEVNNDAFYQKSNLIPLLNKYYTKIIEGERDLFI